MPNNTPTRIIVSVIFIPVILAACYFGGYFFLIFVLGIGLISAFEFSKMIEKKKTSPNILLTLSAVFVLILNTYFRFTDFLIIFLFLIIIVSLSELYRNKDSAILNIGVALFATLYIGLFASSLLALREFYGYSSLLYEQGGYLVISMFITIWVCDSAAFFLGSAFGKHKLFPRVSPNKSWEGAIAGFVFSLVTMAAAKFSILDFMGWFDVIVIGSIIGVLGQYGDLIESLIKRDAGVKDSSALIPGHGGIFDRFDSLLFTSPFVYLYLLAL